MPTPLLPLALAALLGWGFLGDLFGPETVAPPAPDAVAEAVVARVDGARSLHPATADLYAEPGLRWADARARAALVRVLEAAPSDGVRDIEVHADALPALRRALADAEREWEALDGGAGYPVITGDYTGVPAWRRHPLTVGLPVVKPTPVFRKLDTALVEEELARLDD